MTSTSADDIPPFGPRMLALSEKRRAFVCALFDEEAPQHGEGLLIYAARAAGYGTPSSSRASLGVIASRIAHDKIVQLAIAEYSRSAIRAISPEAVRAVRAAIRDPKAKDHLRAVVAVLDRVDPPEQRHVLAVEEDVAPTLEATERVLNKITELARRAGLPSLPVPAPIVDVVEYKVVR